MQQGTLFNQEPAKPLVRRHDPATSVAAALSILPSLCEMQQRTLDAIRRFPDCTRYELAARMQCADLNELGRRTGELKRMELIEVSGTRCCTVKQTGRKCETYRVKG